LVSGGLAACGSSDDKKAPRDRETRPEGGEGGAAGAATAGTSGTDLGGEGGAGVGATGNGGEANGGAQSGGTASGGAPSAGAGGTGEDTGGAAGSGGDSSLPFRGLYVGATGSDLDPGTEAEPFETLAHAASVAEAGDTIVVLDGNLLTSGPSVAIPAGVNLMAKNPGAATLVAQATPPALLTIQGNTRIEGLKFSGHGVVAQFAGVGAAPGVLTIADTQFINCSSWCLNLTGTAQAVVTPPANAPLANGGSSFAHVGDTAELSVNGGTFQSSNNGNLFVVDGDGTLAVEGATFVDGLAKVAHLGGNGSATFSGVTVATLGNTIFQQDGTSKLTILDSDISMKPTVAPKYNCFTNIQNGVGSLTIRDSAVHDCGTGFKGSIPASITLDNVEVYNLDFGADLGVGAAGLGGAITIDGCDFHDFTYTAFRAGSGGNLNTFVFRDTSFSNNVSSMWDMIILDGGNASTLDFGTLASPGGNTFLNANTAVSALRIAMTAGYVSAVGNTWAAAQGADGTCHYAATGAGAKLEITADVVGGSNYVKPYATTTLLLAQNP
jgi:hypothetical protein